MAVTDENETAANAGMNGAEPPVTDDSKLPNNGDAKQSNGAASADEKPAANGTAVDDGTAADNLQDVVDGKSDELVTTAGDEQPKASPEPVTATEKPATTPVPQLETIPEPAPAPPVVVAQQQPNMGLLAPTAQEAVVPAVTTAPAVATVDSAQEAKPSTALLLLGALLAIGTLILFVQVTMSVWRARKLHSALRQVGEDKLGMILTDADIVRDTFANNDSTMLFVAVVGLVFAYGFGSIGSAVTAILNLL